MKTEKNNADAPVLAGLCLARRLGEYYVEILILHGLSWLWHGRTL